MKNRLFAIVSCAISIFFAQHISAQLAEEQSRGIFSGLSSGTGSSEKISFGFRGGINFSSFAEEDNEDSKNRITYSAGLIMDIPVMSNVYIQPGLFLSNKGSKYEAKYSDEEYETKDEMSINLAYLQMPILISYRYALSDGLKWNFDFGPYFAYGIAGNVEYKYTTYDGETEVEEDSFDAFTKGNDNDDDNMGLNRFDAGLCFGTGLFFGKAYIGIQYELGLTNIANKDAWDDYSIKNRNLLISIGYNF